LLLQVIFLSGIELVNLGSVIAWTLKQTGDIQEKQLKAAEQMGITARQNIQDQTPHPMHVQTGAWQRSWDYEVEDQGDNKVLLTVSSNGAEPYFYIQEAINHPGEIGWHKSLPDLKAIYERNLKQ
jgi:hypothetical protein